MSKEIVKTGSVAPQAFSSTQHECTHESIGTTSSRSNDQVPLINVRNESSGR
jgi:hypothetical protein